MKNTLKSILGALLLLSTMAAQAIPIVFTATLSGANEDPPNASTGSGTATVTIDQILNTMRVEVVFADLLSETTVTHIHCCTTDPGEGNIGVATVVPTFPGFPGGVTSGSYDELFSTTELATFNPAFVTANGGTAASAFNTLLAGLNAGTAYLNIHTGRFPAGEIRGFLQPDVVPIPGTLLLLGFGLVLLGLGKPRSRTR